MAAITDRIAGSSESPSVVRSTSADDHGRITAWRPLYVLGAAAALTVVALVPVGAAVYFVWPPPSTVAGYFTAFHASALVGLLNQDLLLLVDQVLMIVVTLALYVALRRTSESLMAIAVVLGIVGATLFIASNTAFAMLGLSTQYAAATSEPQRAAYLAAGEGVLAGYQGTAFVAGYVLTGLADLIMALVMLRSSIFGRPAAYVGIVYGIAALVPPIASTGTVGLVFSFASLVPMLVWLVLIARILLRLDKSVM